jgi:perosamine synthetase
LTATPPHHMPAWPPHDGGISDAFLRMLQDGSWADYNGRHGRALQQALQQMHGSAHCVLCSSGTAAMELALRGCRVGQSAGDEVVLCAYDFKSNFINVLLVGGKPVLVDTLPGEPTMDPQRVRAALTERTRAVIVSHLHGLSGGVQEIRELAAEQGIPVIEDACQAIGGVYGGRRAGSIGDVSIFSFGGSKLITAGRGGALLTSSTAIAQRVQLWQQRGNEAYPLSELQAAVLLPQLTLLEARSVLRMASVDRLHHQLKSDPLLEPVVPAELLLEPERRPAGFQPAFYKMAFRLKTGVSARLRETIASRCQDAGILLSPAFPALHRIHARSRWRAEGDLGNAEDLGQRLMTLHHPLLLQPPAGLDRTATQIKSITADLAGMGSGGQG